MKGQIVSKHLEMTFYNCVLIRPTDPVWLAASVAENIDDGSKQV